MNSSKLPSRGEKLECFAVQWRCWVPAPRLPVRGWKLLLYKLAESLGALGLAWSGGPWISTGPARRARAKPWLGKELLGFVLLVPSRTDVSQGPLALWQAVWEETAAISLPGTRGSAGTDEAD